MFRPHIRCLCLLLIVCLQISCSGKRGDRKETFPVTGQITVDGAVPTDPVQITCHNQAEVDKANPTFPPPSVTGPEGKFTIDTYEKGDGLPVGKYALTFYIGKYNVINNNYGGPDALKDRYKDPKKSEVTFDVTGPEPLDLGTINLTTK